MVERRILGPLPINLSWKASLRQPLAFQDLHTISEPRVRSGEGGGHTADFQRLSYIRRPCSTCGLSVPAPKKMSTKQEIHRDCTSLQGLHWPRLCCVQTRLPLSISLIKGWSKQRHADWVGRADLPCLEYFLLPGPVLT